MKVGPYFYTTVTNGVGNVLEIINRKFLGYYIYDLVAGLPWSMMARWTDTANKRLLGVRQGVDPLYVPSPDAVPMFLRPTIFVTPFFGAAS